MDLESVSVHKHAIKELGQYPAILTLHVVNNPHIYLARLRLLLFLRLYSQKPHLAGTERQYELAQVLAQKLRKYGFDDVELPSYKVLLSFPIEDDPNIVSIVAENGTIVTNVTQQITVRLFFNVLKI